MKPLLILSALLLLFGYVAVVTILALSISPWFFLLLILLIVLLALPFIWRD